MSEAVNDIATVEAVAPVAPKPEIISVNGFSVADLPKLTDDELVELREAAMRQSWYFAILSSAQKRFMNSIYGASANKHYRLRHPYVAEDITAEGRNFIKGADTVINYWLHERWHLEHEVHAQLREEFSDFYDHNVVTIKQLPKRDYVIYTDTDSIYVMFEALLISFGFDLESGEYDRFIMRLNDICIRDMFHKVFTHTIEEKRFGINYFKFDLESISEVIFCLAKKKYLKAYKMSNGTRYLNPSDHIKGTGVEIIQSTTSAMARSMLSFLIKLVIEGKVTNGNFKMTMQKMFDLFENKLSADDTLSIEERCKLIGMNKYHETVLYADKDGWDVRKGALAQYKGAARYNHLIKKHGLTSKYRLINGGKVAWYIDTHGDAFAFHVGEFPEEIAPTMDFYHQYEKIITRPISRLAVLAGLITSNVHSKYFSPVHVGWGGDNSGDGNEFIADAQIVDFGDDYDEGDI